MYVPLYATPFFLSRRGETLACKSRVLDTGRKQGMEGGGPSLRRGTVSNVRVKCPQAWHECHILSSPGI